MAENTLQEERRERTRQELITQSKRLRAYVAQEVKEFVEESAKTICYRCNAGHWVGRDEGGGFWYHAVETSESGVTIPVTGCDAEPIREAFFQWQLKRQPEQ